MRALTEEVMDSKARFAGGSRYQAMAKDFTPITVSADFGALEALKSMSKGITASISPCTEVCIVAKAA